MKNQTLRKNLMSVLLGGVISIPICMGAHNGQEVDAYTIESQSSEIELNAIVQAIEVPETITEPIIGPISLGEFRITAYCPCSKCCGKWADGLTYTGTVATEGRTIAVDPDVIPLGSIVEINGVEYVAEDIGGVIKGDRADIFFDSHQDALEWGVQYHDVYLVEEVIS